MTEDCTMANTLLEPALVKYQVGAFRKVDQNVGLLSKDCKPSGGLDGTQWWVPLERGLK